MVEGVHNEAHTTYPGMEERRTTLRTHASPKGYTVGFPVGYPIVVNYATGRAE